MDRQIKHLEFVQGAVNRLATNSFRIKGWSVVLAASLFVLAAQEGRIAFSVIALVPIALFCSLDGYFLWQERLFRALYDHVRNLDESKIDFSMDVTPFMGKSPRTWWSAIFSKSLLIFYVALSSTVILAVAIYLSFNGGLS